MKRRTVLLPTFIILLVVAAFPGLVAGQSCKVCATDGQSFFCNPSPVGFATCQVYGDYCQVALSCTSGSGCFMAGTTVDTPEGPRAIEALQVGDLVISYDEEKDIVTTAPVTHTFVSLGCDHLIINGTLEVTSSHPFLVHGSWVKSGDIQIGDEFVDRQGNAVAVRSIEHVSKGVRVYNITVGGTHTFYADGLLVHNKFPDPFG